jgi:D-proline reductase (dithiol) PrdB
MMVDSFKFLPRSIAYFYQMNAAEPETAVPWTPLSKPLAECTFSLLTSGGLYRKGVDEPFDVAREKAEPTWGDPSFRMIPTDIQQAELGAAHLHINTDFVLADINCLLPIRHFQELAAEGVIGRLAPTAYSFMGFQGLPHDTSAWEQTYAPQVIAQMKEEGVDCVLLTPA